MQKLIVLLFLLSLIVTGFRLSLACKASTPERENIPNHDDLNCPNEIFKMKHYCGECHSAGDALRFSMLRNMGFRPTNVNTVFIGGPSYKYNERRKLCEATSAVRTFRCSQLLDNPAKARCKEVGRCTAKHDSVNGHLYYQHLICDTGFTLVTPS